MEFFSAHVLGLRSHFSKHKWANLLNVPMHSYVCERKKEPFFRSVTDTNIIVCLFHSLKPTSL